ncbi:ribonuclease HII [Hyphobacterium sp. SN044]|uniref:ribonuclease HII n=1 Tax=Hyphobacterium sp. SN044 TaxID=2912575 RepID=UPI001F015E20|nr:ribonuclease HII [Hyphobacterium sp. SN044]MCF8880797.1 ribonuclease HII [Hyphobacterium sp. SN044]
MNPPALIAGIDEAGRGPLAGPVVAAAVIFHPRRRVQGLDDSKRLSERARTILAARIRQKAWVGIGIAEPEEIDRRNILHATMIAMCRALWALPVRPDRALIDGNRVPARLDCDGEAIVGGDASVPEISAASIIAKTARDALMQRADTRWPGYGFAAHKGYGTATHLAALAEIGPCPIHRLSFAPIAQRALGLTPR